MITARIEDYLEELFLLESTGRTVTVTDLAERLKITKGTVTATVQKLVDQGFLNHERYGALHLTDSGRRKGLVVFRRHEGLRAFFHELLGLDREKSSEMACCMEHYVDAVTEEGFTPCSNISDAPVRSETLGWTRPSPPSKSRSSCRSP